MSSLFDERQVESEIAALLTEEGGSRAKQLGESSRLEMRIALIGARHVARHAGDRIAMIETNLANLSALLDARTVGGPPTPAGSNKVRTKGSVETLAGQVFAAVKGYIDRRLNSELPEYAYVFDATKTYRKGHFVTHGGSMWHANKEVRDVRPGESPDHWTLAVKAGRDGRDAR